MLRHIKLTNVGPAPTMEMTLGERLNLLTGDNGLGKSFLLDICWWALTRKWPAEVNKRLTSGMMAKPRENGVAAIGFELDARHQRVEYESTFDRRAQAWTGRVGRPWNPGLVLYAQVDGSFAVWDPARNYWRQKGNVDVQDRLPAYVFSPREVWDGIKGDEGKPLCNGLILDWAGWQKEKGTVFESLCSVLRTVSPSDDERIEPGELTRISLEDSRDIPTLMMPYGLSVPVLHASAGIRRIISLAYLLVWSWEEHKKASKLLDQQTTSQVIFLVDEIEAHLHPKWQRRIVKALLSVVDSLTQSAQIQLIAATHSPLVMASAEPEFDAEKDKWFDLDFVVEGQGQTQVVLQARDFVRRGDVTSWLTSEAFDLKEARSIAAERVLEEAALALSDVSLSERRAKEIEVKLQNVLSDVDPFWIRWRYVAEKKGWRK